METQGHHPIGSIECLFNPVPVMDIDIDIHDPLVIPQQLKDAKYDI